MVFHRRSRRVPVTASMSACILLLACSWAPAAPAVAVSPPSPADLSPEVPSTVIVTPPSKSPAAFALGRLASARTVVATLAGTVGRKLLAISNTRLDQLFVPKEDRLTAPSVSRAGAADGVNGNTPKAGAAAAAAAPPGPYPPPGAPAPTANPAVLEAEAAPKRDRAADWAAVGLVLLFVAMGVGIVAPVVRGLRERKILLPMHSEGYVPAGRR